MMKLFILCTSFTAIMLLIYCSKKQDPPHLVHCDNLVNDAPIPGDQGFVFIPNAFTPNGDGLNDRFHPLTTHMKSISVTVYDQNNNILYHSESLAESWSPGVQTEFGIKYYYRVEGVTEMDRQVAYCGYVFPLLCYPGGINKNDLNFEDEADGAGGWTTPTAEPILDCN